MTTVMFGPPVCAGCQHQYLDHITDPDDLDVVLPAGGCTHPGCTCQAWTTPEGP